MKGGSKPRFPAIDCPHCGSRADIRSSEKLTPCFRNVRLRCRNDECGHTFVASFAVSYTIVPSRCPNPEIILPMSQAHRPGHPDWRPGTPANDGGPILLPHADNDPVAREIG